MVMGVPAHLANSRTEGTARSTTPERFVSGPPAPLPAKSRLNGFEASLTEISVAVPPAKALGLATAMTRLTCSPFHIAEPCAASGLSILAIDNVTLIALASQRFSLR